MKKPFYEVVWFWLFVVFAVTTLILGADAVALQSLNSDYKAELASSKKASSSSKSTSKTKHTYSVDQEAVLSADGKKMYGLTLKSATTQFNAHGQSLVQENDVDSLKLSQGNGVQITMDYTNYGDTNSFLPLVFDFVVYQDGKAGKMISQQDGQDEVAQGRTGTTTFWCNLPNPVADSKNIEIDYQSSDMSEPITFTAITK